jgi:hypothetical protein
MESEEATVARQRLSKPIPSPTNTHATTLRFLNDSCGIKCSIYSERNVNPDSVKFRLTRAEAVSNTSSVTLRVVGGDEKGSLKSETVKYGRESQGTRTREKLRWQEPAAYTKDRPVLSSERAPQKNKTVTVKQSGALHQDLLTD